MGSFKDGSFTAGELFELMMKPCSTHTSHILLVDDNAANILVASTFLEVFGYTYNTAQNGLEAVEKMKSDICYSAILMDVRMPIMCGLEATRAIREFEKNDHRTPICIIAMSAETAIESREKCFAAGMNEFIAKPFDPAELHDKLIDIITE